MTVCLVWELILLHVDWKLIFGLIVVTSNGVALAVFLTSTYASCLCSDIPFPIYNLFQRFHLFLQSSVCEKIMELLGQNKIDHHQRQVAILSQDSFYKVLTPEQKAKALKGQFNFDHPGMQTLNSWWCSSCAKWGASPQLACSRHMCVTCIIDFSCL